MFMRCRLVAQKLVSFFLVLLLREISSYGVVRIIFLIMIVFLFKTQWTLCPSVHLHAPVLVVVVLLLLSCHIQYNMVLLLKVYIPLWYFTHLFCVRYFIQHCIGSVSFNGFTFPMLFTIEAIYFCALQQLHWMTEFMIEKVIQNLVLEK